jgi:adenylosuccinate synthase
MAVRAVVGANWGDEGKGKIIDYLAAHSDMVVRFQGGSNAGHTIINSFGKFALHLLPSGVFSPHVANIAGPGVAINIPLFLEEYDSLLQRGVPAPQIFVSERAQIVLPYHTLFDRYEEERLGERQFGSTLSGIAPFYADKALKTGLQVCDLRDARLLQEKLAGALEQKNVLLAHLYGKPELTAGEIAAALLACRERFMPFVADASGMIRKAAAAGKSILLEGQLGALRDPDHGIYPYTTSSSPLAGSAAVGAGIAPHQIKNVTAVVKAYSSCVGAGPFVTELAGEAADELRERGGDAGEYGATTGRPRRMGWFDAVATRYGCQVQGATEAALTLLDVLGYLEEIPVCTAYAVDGATTEDFPVTPVLARARPVYTRLAGWRCDISRVRDFHELPALARAYVDFIEEQIGVPIRLISVGPKREAMIVRGN